jgi:hypothetical protein
VQIYYINNAGAGFAERIEVADGTTVGQLFADRMPGRRPDDYLVRVDRQPAAADEPLAPGCRVSITPTKIEGAAA